MHERDVHSDFLLTIVRELLPSRPDLKVVLMSATIQTQLFLDYFRATTTDCTHLAVEGRMFPVKTLFLDDLCAVPTLAEAAQLAMEQCSQRGRDGEPNTGGGAMPLPLIADLVEYLHKSRLAADEGR